MVQVFQNHLHRFEHGRDRQLRLPPQQLHDLLPILTPLLSNLSTVFHADFSFRSVVVKAALVRLDGVDGTEAVLVEDAGAVGVEGVLLAWLRPFGCRSQYKHGFISVSVVINAHEIVKELFHADALEGSGFGNLTGGKPAGPLLTSGLAYLALAVHCLLLWFTGLLELTQTLGGMVSDGPFAGVVVETLAGDEAVQVIAKGVPVFRQGVPVGL